MVIMFLMVLLIVGMLATAPAIKTQIQRDREEEMIHRGAQYSRAIKKYFKKFGRYPGTIEQLENTNNLRFLRKQYKDPMSADGKWKLLHVGDVKIGTTSNFGTPVSAMARRVAPAATSASLRVSPPSEDRQEPWADQEAALAERQGAWVERAAQSAALAPWADRRPRAQAPPARRHLPGVQSGRRHPPPVPAA